jgi:hypothetical protein
VVAVSKWAKLESTWNAESFAFTSLYNTQNKGKAVEAYPNRLEWFLNCEVTVVVFKAPHTLLYVYPSKP